ncbi:MAG: hypothetical protein JO316_10485 [Abitibacteriaceae bacterium]|nr:hypothetical protein [Abditibacteriaceae bacterium]
MSAHSLKTLTPEQTEQFIQDGYVLVREAFPRQVAEAVIDLVWSEAPIDPADRSTWARKRYVIQKSLQSDAISGAIFGAGSRHL